MLHNITWGSYWYALSISLCCYYSFILWRYYRQDLLRYLAHQKVLIFPVPKAAASNREQRVHRHAEISEDAMQDPLLQGRRNYQAAFEALLDELDAYFEQVKGKEVQRAELLFSFGQIIRKYPTFHNAPTGEFICYALAGKSKLMFDVDLSQEEISRLVKDGLPRS